VQQIPTTETEPYHSIGDYGKNKAFAKNCCLQPGATNNFPLRSCVPSHSYGEGGDLIRSFGPSQTFVDRLRRGKPLIVQGDGNSLWASCHVDDVARGFIGTMGVPQCLGEAYNITGDEWMTWNTYHQQVAEVVGGTFEPVHMPTDVLLQVAPQWAGGTHEIFAWPSVFDNSKIKRDTGYTGQTVSWKQGVERTVNWLEAQGRLKNSDEDTFEDELVAAWQTQTASLPRQPAAV
jgi:nucleoside-diphosphate-sugar epimerase